VTCGLELDDFRIKGLGLGLGGIGLGPGLATMGLDYISAFKNRYSSSLPLLSLPPPHPSLPISSPSIIPP